MGGGSWDGGWEKKGAGTGGGKKIQGKDATVYILSLQVSYEIMQRAYTIRPQMRRNSTSSSG